MMYKKKIQIRIIIGFLIIILMGSGVFYDYQQTQQRAEASPLTLLQETLGVFGGLFLAEGLFPKSDVEYVHYILGAAMTSCYLPANASEQEIFKKHMKRELAFHLHYTGDFIFGGTNMSPGLDIYTKLEMLRYGIPAGKKEGKFILFSLMDMILEPILQHIKDVEYKASTGRDPMPIPRSIESDKTPEERAQEMEKMISDIPLSEAWWSRDPKHCRDLFNAIISDPHFEEAIRNMMEKLNTKIDIAREIISNYEIKGKRSLNKFSCQQYLQAQRTLKNSIKERTFFPIIINLIENKEDDIQIHLGEKKRNADQMYTELQGFVCELIPQLRRGWANIDEGGIDSSNEVERKKDALVQVKKLIDEVLERNRASSNSLEYIKIREALHFIEGIVEEHDLRYSAQDIINSFERRKGFSGEGMSDEEKKDVEIFSSALNTLADRLGLLYPVDGHGLANFCPRESLAATRNLSQDDRDYRKERREYIDRSPITKVKLLVYIMDKIEIEQRAIVSLEDFLRKNGSSDKALIVRQKRLKNFQEVLEQLRENDFNDLEALKNENRTKDRIDFYYIYEALEKRQRESDIQ